MNPVRRIRNLGILAHVDAGKTTLTEHMLYLSGSVRALGNVDKGTSLSDAMSVEKRRGISVRASALGFDWQGVQVNLIDTPGHVDFAAEVERSLRAVDCAVLVLSAVEGVQAQSGPLWRALEALKVPTILFVNKIDRAGADAAGVVEQVRDEFSAAVVRLFGAVDEGGDGAGVVDLMAAADADLVEAIAAEDDALLERYLAGESLTTEVLEKALAMAVKDRRLFPVLCGAAKNNVGVEALLDAIVGYFPEAPADEEAPAAGVVFRLDHDERLGRVAGVRLFAGQLKVRDRIHNQTADREERVAQIKKAAAHRLEDAPLLRAGEIGFVCGLPEARIGDVLGDAAAVPGGYALTEPLLAVQVTAKDPARHAELAAALQQLSSEDPHLNFEWVGDERELHVKIMGTVQTEILTEVLAERFGIAAEFARPTVVYKETPAKAAHGAESYTMPKPCWAIVKYRMEPGLRGSGVAYASEVGVNAIGQKYQSEIAASIDGALKQGIKGWEVADLKITLVDGSDHVLHSRPGNFKLATNIALLQGLKEAGSMLLEPFVAFRIAGPREVLGKATADIVHMRGTFEPAAVAGENFVLKGRVPLATSMDYAIRLGAISGGRATYGARFDGYEACADELGVVRPYKGICPLDRSKYILQMRGAITESLRGD